MKFTIGSYEIFGLVRFCLDGPLHEGGVKVQASEGGNAGIDRPIRKVKCDSQWITVSGIGQVNLFS